MQSTSPLHKNGAHDDCKNVRSITILVSLDTLHRVIQKRPQSDPEEACRQDESSVVHAYGKPSNVFPINNGMAGRCACFNFV